MPQAACFDAAGTTKSVVFKGIYERPEQKGTSVQIRYYRTLAFFSIKVAAKLCDVMDHLI